MIITSFLSNARDHLFPFPVPSAPYADILKRSLHIFSFVIAFFILYSLYPRSFEGDPGWEGTWQGRFFYLFFLWLVSLETILNWGELRTSKIDKLRSLRTVAFIVALSLPTMYVIVANYCGLNSIIVEIAQKNNVPHALLMPLSTEYLVFTIFFILIILLAYGITGLVDFSISAPFLGIVGVLYTIDILYPYGRFTPFQILVLPTATLAAGFLSFMGYKVDMRVITSPDLGLMPRLFVEDSMGRQAGQFAIAWPCAGVESLIIYTLTILLFLKNSLIPWWQRVVYFVIGAVVTYFINVLRIVTIYVISIPWPLTENEVWRFHNIYGQLISIFWIISYPLIIIGSRILWEKIVTRKSGAVMA